MNRVLRLAHRRCRQFRERSAVYRRRRFLLPLELWAAEEENGRTRRVSLVIVETQTCEDFGRTLRDPCGSRLRVLCRLEVEDVTALTPGSERVEGFCQPAVSVQDFGELVW